MDSADRNGAWFAYATIDDAEPIDNRPLKAPLLVPEDNSDEEVVVDEDLSVTVEIPDEWKIEETSQSVSTAMALGILAGLIAIFASFLVWQFFLRNQ